MPSEVYTTSSSDDENYRKSRSSRKKSTNTGDNTPRHKGQGSKVKMVVGAVFEGSAEILFEFPATIEKYVFC